MSVRIDQASELLGKSRRTIYYRITTGQLQTIRIGTSSRVTMESLQLQPELIRRQPLPDRLKPLVHHQHRANLTLAAATKR